MVMRFGRSVAVVCLAFAALLQPVPASAQPVLSVSATSIGSQTYQGTNAPSQTFQVRNAGKRALKWNVVVPSGAWVSASPGSGTNGGTVTLRFSTAGLPAGVHQSSFRVDSNGGSVTVPVSVTIVAGQSAPAPPRLAVSCPANKSATSTNGSAVVVTYSATTSGGVAPVTTTGTPASGSSFPVGTTPVTVSAASSDGQTASCGFSVTVAYTPPPPPPPPPPTSAYGPQSTVTCPAGAVDIWPGMDIQATVNNYPGNTTFCVRAGTHSLRASITPKTGDTFVGEYGAILDGTGWSASDDTQAAFRSQNQDIDYVTIRNLVIRNMPQRGINAYYYLSDHWTIEFTEIASNRTGIVFPADTTIRNSYIHHNSYSGYMAPRAHNSVIENNEIAYNGWEQKVAESANVTFRNNFVHHNAGVGIWFDYDNTNPIVEGNRVEDNGHIGIFFEIGSGAIIRNNTIRRSKDAGVFLGTSKNVQIYGNTFENNFRGITYFLDCPSLGGGSISFDLANNTAHDNTIVVGTESGALASAFSYASCTSTQVAPYLNGSKGLTFSRNTYDVPSTSGWYWLWNAVKQFAQWQALGQDVEGIVR